MQPKPELPSVSNGVVPQSHSLLRHARMLMTLSLLSCAPTNKTIPANTVFVAHVKPNADINDEPCLKEEVLPPSQNIDLYDMPSLQLTMPPLPYSNDLSLNWFLPVCLSPSDQKPYCYQPGFGKHMLKLNIPDAFD